MRLKNNLPDAEETSVRKCIVTGKRVPREELIRFVLSPEDSVVTPDFSQSLPGRGAWVSARRACVERAVAQGLFGRAFRGRAQAPEDLAIRIEAALLKQAAMALGMARKAGSVVTGFEKVRGVMKENKAAAFVYAQDAAADGLRKLMAIAPKERAGAMTRDELSAALGMGGVTFAALRSGPHTARFLNAVRRLENYRSQ